MGTVSKALDLLGLFSRAQPQVGLSDLSRLAGVNKATCFRLMSELQEYGLVEQVGPGREYRLGPAVLRLAALREAHVPTREAALPVLQALAKATGETAHLSHLVAGELRMLAYAYSPAHAMKVMMEDADVLPFHATSSGMVVLAHMAPEAAAAVLKGPLVGHTDKTLTTPTAVRERMARVRASGLAESEGGFEADVSSIAVPIFDPSGDCTKALALAWPTARLSGERLVAARAALIVAAGEITRQFGGVVPDEIQSKWQRGA